MASLNNGNHFWGGENWFKSSSPKPLLLHFPTLSSSSSKSSSPCTITYENAPNFASIGILPKLFEKSFQKGDGRPDLSTMVDQMWWEIENRPDYRHTPEVEEILEEQRRRKNNPTEEEKRKWEEFGKDPIGKLAKEIIELEDAINEKELKDNSAPFRREDKKYWQSLPHVIGLDGRPMPRKAIKNEDEASDKFWDFARQFFLGMWGFAERPYPTCKPWNVAQAIGYKRLEARNYDFIMRSLLFYYKDRLGRTRGPANLLQLRTAWAAGIIDRHTFIWGDDMVEWAPISMTYGMERAVASWDAKLGASLTSFMYKVANGLNPWVPLKCEERKTLKQLQEEAIADRDRDLAVMKANGGQWPGVAYPDHTFFLWAGGSELTPLLEQDHMPNKYIPKNLRIQLQEQHPGLRPWEVLSLEQSMQHVTYGGKWHRKHLGTYTTGPPYIQNWNKDVMRLINVFHKVSQVMYDQFVKHIPGFDKIMDKVEADIYARVAKRDELMAAKK